MAVHRAGPSKCVFCTCSACVDHVVASSSADSDDDFQPSQSVSSKPALVMRVVCDVCTNHFPAPMLYILTSYLMQKPVFFFMKKSDRYVIKRCRNFTRKLNVDLPINH